ncbi:IS3 family transposase [Maribacter sp. ACAM166]|uniref:IS3 family transposase n=1 Tax=Maribacter sp. ACAM166 TaxID=2508996 RepID=UPI002017A990|nr:IS3 family transposase [Maribacter sp. ACAM166]
MSREKRNYTVEFKEKAVELSYARGSVVEICRELDIPTSVLSRWRRESGAYGKNSFPGKGNPKLTDEQREIAELKKRLMDAELERDIPKKGDSHLLLGRQEKYRFIKHHKFKFPVGKMCKMFKLSKSSYYNWLGREPSKRWLENQTISSVIRVIFIDSFESYGAPRIKEELSKKGYRVSRPRVARIMRANNLFARRKRRFSITTDSRHNYPLARNILDRNFTVSRKNQVWVSDITYIETKQGWMYLTVIIDLFHRKVVGWSMGETLNTSDTIIPAWNMAVKSNNITKELIFHSDRGSQYAGHRFTNILKSYDGTVKQSMSRKGNCWDNAVAESFFKSLKVEWVYKHSYGLRSEAELSVFQWIETWYNRRRMHSTLGYKTIEEFENEMYNQQIAA